MHYLFHVLLALLAGVFFTTTFWALSLRRWALRNAQWPEAMWHGHTALKLLRCPGIAGRAVGRTRALPTAGR